MISYNNRYIGYQLSIKSPNSLIGRANWWINLHQNIQLTIQLKLTAGLFSYNSSTFNVQSTDVGSTTLTNTKLEHPICRV
ncbi:hypothetical protein AAFF_G00103350 [Aldrovandia affinis]|uniref:Uncharacterized protein n=1 Tax=Aldrovandia affinis TaxID=143900 RepID=A0AAD7WBG4_9TELE|nr:hypothetical protein AAFF_G00103350 [Aldrovandia affinis]